MILRRDIFFFAILVIVAVFGQIQASSEQENSIQWVTQYEKAVELAKKNERPIVLFFTGSDWCGWCNKLEKEVFDTREFLEMTGDKLIFVKLDFPMKTNQDQDIRKQNEQLQKKYAVKGYPTIVMLDHDQLPIGVTGYRSGGGKQYAEHLMKMVNEYTAYKQQMKRLGAQKFSGKELKRLYQKAHELGLANDQNLLVRIGMDSDLAPYFIGERYRFLVSEGQIHSKEAADLKQRLLKIDPENKFLSHYQVAVIEFEAYSEKVQSSEMSPDEAVKPLIAYIDKYGAEDTENLWRINLVISQVYLDHNRLDQALKFAQESYAAAPPTIQTEIAMTIKNIQKQMGQEGS